jgi:hypothetical protein
MHFLHSFRSFRIARAFAVIENLENRGSVLLWKKLKKRIRKHRMLKSVFDTLTILSGNWKTKPKTFTSWKSAG